MENLNIYFGLGLVALGLLANGPALLNWVKTFFNKVPDDNCCSISEAREAIDTALHFARHYGNTEMEECLVKAGQASYRVQERNPVDEK